MPRRAGEPMEMRPPRAAPPVRPRVTVAPASPDGADAAGARAERLPDWVEAAGDAAPAEVVFLREHAAFLQEQLRSCRHDVAYALERDLADPRAERAALLQEMALLNGELQER